MKCVVCGKYEATLKDYRESPLGTIGSGKLQDGVNITRIDDAYCYIQGGALGPVGHLNDLTSSKTAYNKSISGSMTVDNYYGGYDEWEFQDPKKVLIREKIKEFTDEYKALENEKFIFLYQKFEQTF